MIRHRSRLPLVLILALAIGSGVFWLRRDDFREASGRTDDSPMSENLGNIPEGFGPIPLPGTRENAPAVPQRRDVADASGEMGQLAARMSRETDDLKVVTHPDGRRSVSLEGRFMHMSAVVTGADGKPAVRCFTDFHQMVAALPGSAPIDPPRPVTHAR